MCRLYERVRVGVEGQGSSWLIALILTVWFPFLGIRSWGIRYNID